MKLATILSDLGACPEARAWAKDYPDLQTAWRECKRSDWMIWLLARTLDQNDPRLRLLACDFAETVLPFVPAGEDRPKTAIEVARRFAEGEATRAAMAAASAAAWAAASAAAWDAAAAWAAAWAAAMAAAEAAAEAAAMAAAGAAASAAASAAARADQSDLIRRYFPKCPPIQPSLIHTPKPFKATA